MTTVGVKGLNQIH